MRWALALTLCAGSAQAVTLEFPANATLQTELVETPGEYALPTGPWTPDGMPVLIGKGEFRQQAWRIGTRGVTPLQLMEPLQAQLEADGFELLYRCASEACGGFDFRFETRVLPAPDMYVDVGDFLFIGAQREVDGSTELVSILTSRSPEAAYVQITRVGAPIAAGELGTSDAPEIRAATPVASGSFAEMLERDGRVILSDLAFETGSAQLGDGPFGSLSSLADYLRENETRTVALVGHTDSVGSLEGNIALSRRRAASVLERLVENHGVPRRQMEAQGMGYLAPLSTNLTEEGRTLNRRVEVIITSTE